MSIRPAGLHYVNSVLVSYGGETKTLAEWSRILHIPRQTLMRRFEGGWTPEQALTTPVRRYQIREVLRADDL